MKNILTQANKIWVLQMMSMEQDFKYQPVPSETGEFYHSDMRLASACKNFATTRAIGNGNAIMNNGRIANPP